MDKVGGFHSYLLLEQDELAYEDVLIVLAGESDARKVQEMKAKHGK